MLILGEKTPLKENIKTSFRRYRFLWLILVLTAVFDFATTVVFMRYDGIHTEGNFIVRWLASTIGIVPGVFIAKVLQVVAAAGFSALSLTLSRAVLLVIILVNLLAVFRNVL
jgi:hypothetical protein